MHHPTVDERILDLRGNLLGRTIRKVTARLDLVRKDVTVDIELSSRETSDPSSAQPYDRDHVTVQLFGASVFKVLDGGVSRLLAEDGTVLREPPTAREVSQGVRELVPGITKALAASDAPASERPTIPISSDGSGEDAVTTRPTAPSRR